MIGALTLAAAWAAALYAKDAAKHTKAGADEARRAADAAERGLKHSEEITRSELRAYLAAERETFELQDGNLCFATVHLRNVGQTPAQEMTYTRDVVLVVGDERTVLPRTPDADVGLMGTVGPKVPVESYTYITLSDEQLEQLRGGQLKIEIVIMIEFVDMFGERWSYRQDLYAVSRSLQSGVLYTEKCQTNHVDLNPAQGELNLQTERALDTADQTSPL